jgi:hypothetical protein
MGALRKTALVAAAAVVAAVLALLLAHRSPAPAAEPTTDVAVRAGFDRRVAQFGDPVAARVVVMLDRNAVRPSTLRVTSGVAPFTPLAAATTTRTRSGRLETVTIEQRLACLTAPCLARRLTLPRVRVSVERTGGGTATATTGWHAPTFRSRVDAKDLARATPQFAADLTPPAPSYRISPTVAETVLAIVAALAAAGAAVLLATSVRRRRPVAETDELARALRLVREAQQRPVPDRRRALGLLARLLHGRDDALRAAASDLAWSAPAPEPPAVDDLVGRVEQEAAP